LAATVATQGDSLIDVLDIDSVEPGVGYVYRWVNLVNGKMYIGSHSGSKPYYKASGVAIKKAFSKHGMENFRREFLYVGSDYRLEEEKSLTLVDAMNNPMYYNMMNTAIGVGSGPDNPRYGKPGTRLGLTHTDETKQKISAIHKGKTISDDMKETLRLAFSGEKNPNYGKTMSDEQRSKISETRKSLGLAAGSNNPMYGKPRTEDVKEKLREANLGKKASDETRARMSRMRKGKTQQVISCPHCPKTGGNSAMKRYHFDRCKQKDNNCQDYQEIQA
jgi:group I intron endonuclease